MKYVILFLIALWIALTPSILWLFWITFNTYHHLQDQLKRVPYCIERPSDPWGDHTVDEVDQAWIDEHAPLITEDFIESINNSKE